jgi:hypothetical protein
VTAPPTNADGTLGNPFNVSYAEQTDSQGNPWQVGTDQMTGPNQVAITDYGSTDANYNDAFNYDQNSYLNGPNNVNIGDSGYTGDQQAYNDAYNYSPDSQSYDNTPTQDTSYNPMDSYSSDPSYSTDTSSWDLSSMDNSGGDYSGDYAQGGAIPDGPTTGGAIPQSASPSMGQQTDDIHAKVNADEFIMPRDVAIWKGQEFFYKLIADSRAKLAQAQQSGVGGKPSSPPTGPVRFASQAMR